MLNPEDDPSLEELEAAGDMYDQIKAGTFYDRHNQAVQWLKDWNKVGLENENDGN